MFDDEQLRELGHAERLRLIRALVALEKAEPAADGTVRRRRMVALAAIIVCCVILAAWIGVLAVTLPRYYRSGGWRGAWVGFDLAELAAFAATGWAAWRRRQVLIICLVVLATLLCCDAWFDVILDSGTGAIWGSLASAVFIELPLAFLMFNAARRLIRISGLAAVSGAGPSGYSAQERQQLPIWKIPLAGVGVAREEHAARTGETSGRSGGKSHSHRW